MRRPITLKGAHKQSDAFKNLVTVILIYAWIEPSCSTHQRLILKNGVSIVNLMND